MRVEKHIGSHKTTTSGKKLDINTITIAGGVKNGWTFQPKMFCFYQELIWMVCAGKLFLAIHLI
jgi:hypothetical protein